MIQPLIRHALRDRLQSVRWKTLLLRNFTRYEARHPAAAKTPGRTHSELGIIPDNANKIGAKYRYWPTTTSVYTTLQTPISL
jgi:hypothetical protein